MLYAGAAVGVSHLVQSTQAGAEWGLSLVWVVILANILKYPFFEFGPRYAGATGESLVEAYRRMWGGLPLILFILITLGTMFIILGAITIVTAGLASYAIDYAGVGTIPVAGNDWGGWIWGKTDGQINVVALSGRLLVVCTLILALGRYHLLDRLMKYVVLLLTVTTLIALGIAVSKGQLGMGEGFGLAEWSDSEMVLAWIIPLVGWMPAPLDIAVWHSVWSVEKQQDGGQEAGKLGGALLDFRIGYWGTTGLAVCFVALGAFVIFGTGVPIERTAGAFARQLIEMYASALGEWARPLIVVAALMTMLSTTLTCLDAFPRILARSSRLYFPEHPRFRQRNGWYWIWIVVSAIGTWIILSYFLENMKQLVNLATTISFVVAPLLATFSYFAIFRKDFPVHARPARWYQYFAIAGLVFLYLFAGYYLLV